MIKRTNGNLTLKPGQILRTLIKRNEDAPFHPSKKSQNEMKQIAVARSLRAAIVFTKSHGGVGKAWLFVKTIAALQASSSNYSPPPLICISIHSAELTGQSNNYCENKGKISPLRMNKNGFLRNPRDSYASCVGFALRKTHDSFT
ncbi:hypothetical protein TNCV_339531 [Trichonephila clavipes]|nr:hypothetical protein TNCV_339531 [Trichonephila clavipes]